MSQLPIDVAREIYRRATPVLRIHGIGGRRWRRNVAKGSRIGPWLQGQYDILDEQVWRAKSPSLYLVAGGDDVIRYVGISRNRMKDRWRESPALDAETSQPLPQRQLFHSQCWRLIEKESATKPNITYEVRCIHADQLLRVVGVQGRPLSALTVLADDGEGVVAAVERWLCNNKSADLVPWNVAMTAR